MTRIAFSAVGRTPFQRLLGHNPSLLTPWLALEASFETEAVGLDAGLREQVRRTLALGNGCEYCQAVGGPPDATHADLRRSVAVGFAQLVQRDHRSLDAGNLEALRDCFTEREVSALAAYICFTTASQMFGAILGLSAQDRAPEA